MRVSSLQKHLFGTAFSVWLLPDVREGFQFFLCYHPVLELRIRSIFLEELLIEGLVSFIPYLSHFKKILGHFWWCLGTNLQDDQLSMLVAERVQQACSLQLARQRHLFLSLAVVGLDDRSQCHTGNPAHHWAGPKPGKEEGWRGRKRSAPKPPGVKNQVMGWMCPARLTVLKSLKD